ncbi:MAG: response regulator [Methanoregulaceae archaeon]|nr:response regulator [Methanoregulaceae archaeon]
MAILSVLLVDDEPALLDVTRLFLQKDGMMTFETCISAEEALKKMESISFDAIVSDFEMPGMDGIELLKHLRSRGNTTSFIIFTGKGREEVVIEALNNGADFYLQKGGDPRSQFAELRNMILKAVQRRKAEEALIESERRYRNLIEKQKDVIARFLPEIPPPTDGKSSYCADTLVAGIPESLNR